MTKLKNTLLLIIILGGSTYGGIKGYIYYNIKKQVDNFAKMALPYATFDYGGIGSTLEGTIILEEITFRPNGINDVIQIDKLKLITPGLSTLLGGAESIKRGEFPKKAGLSLQGIHINLSGELVGMMVKAEAKAMGYQPEKGLACSFSQAFMTEQYKELGVNELIMDAKVKIERGANSQSIIFKVLYALRDIEEYEVQFTMDNPQSIMVGMMGGPFTPPIRSVSLSYRPDPGFNQRAILYCAKLKGVSVKEFIGQLINQSDEDYMRDFGFVPGPGIRSALQGILINADELRIVALPGESLDLSTLHLYNPKDIPDLLELLVTVNGKTIDDLSFTLPTLSDTSGESASLKLPMLDMIRSATQANTPSTIKPEAKQKEKVKKLKYHTVKPEDLKYKIGREAYIETVDGKTRAGRIESIENGIISLQIRMHGGTITSHIPISKAAKIEVQEWL